MKNLFPLMILLCLVFSAGNRMKEKRRLQTLVLHRNDSVPSNFPGANYFADTVTLKVPPKNYHPSISLESVSSYLFMKLVAGASAGGYSGDSGPATSAQVLPAIPWVDSSGNIYIPDYDNHRIRKVDAVSGIITTFGGTGTSSVAGTAGPITSVGFYQPWSIIGNSAGTVLYFSDLSYVWKYNFPDNIVSVFAGSPSLGEGYSAGQNNGPATSAQVNHPAGLWLTTSGVLYFADFYNHLIRKVVTATTIVSTVAGNGVGSGFSGDGGPAISAALKFPYSVYSDTNGMVFIADTFNYRIRLVGANNIITTFAGTGTDSPFYGENIQAISANLNLPTDVKGDSLGNIYIADYNNCIIRMIDTSRIISTLFGTQGSCGVSAGISTRFSSISKPQGIWLDTLSNIYFSSVGVWDSVYRGIVVSFPTSQPSIQPSAQPSRQPSAQPILRPTAQPSSQPVSFPSVLPTNHPSCQPTSQPSVQPSSFPSQPSSQPTRKPSSQPTLQASAQPTRQPTSIPSLTPTLRPYCRPTNQPSGLPTWQPYSKPSVQPTSQPSRQPTIRPSSQPSSQPRSPPSCRPTTQPYSKPTAQPMKIPFS
jgi:hypothetical protein